MAAPDIRITKSGETQTVSVDRLKERIGRLRYAIEKPTVKDEKRATLQTELDSLLKSVEEQKKALESI